jgi:hypothetical protein
MMPSLLKYFTIVGGLLFAGLLGLNAFLDPGGPGPKLVAEAPKPALRFDPRASKVERLRAEEAAQKAAANGTPPAPVAVLEQPLPAVQPAPEPAPVVSASVQPSEPARTVAPAALTTAADEAEAERAAARATREKAKAEKARKQRVARERARTRAMQEASASRMQDQIYYGYAPRPSYGPFAQGGGWGGGGGWGRTW